MKTDFMSENIGTQLGQQAVDHSVELASNFVEFKSRQIAAAYRSRIIECRLRLGFLQEREKEIKERLRLVPPPGDLRTRRRRCIYYVSVAILLTFSGFFFALLAFDPFRFGWKSILYCIAIAVVTPFVLDKLLDLWKGERLLRTLAAIAALAAIVSLVLLALIRGEILLQQLQVLDTVVVSGLESSTQPQNSTNFYSQTLGWLRLTMALLAIALEIGAGLALHDAWRYGSNLDNDQAKLEAILSAIQQEMTALCGKIAEYESLAEQFVNAFWADFFRAMLDGTARHAITKGIAALALLVLLSSGASAADRGMHLIVALDLSQSLQVTSPGGKSEYRQNLAAIECLLSTVPVGSRVTIIGITDQSLTRPYLLMSAQVAADPGYFNERLVSARKQLTQAWSRVSKDLRPNYGHTDVFGALLLASQIFDEAPAMRKVLVVLSDARHEALGINLEKPDVINSAEIIFQAERTGLVASLTGVEVHVIGAVAPGKLPAYWKSVRQFWTQYFEKTGATLVNFSVTRSLPNLSQRPVRPPEKINGQFDR